MEKERLSEKTLGRKAPSAKPRRKKQHGKPLKKQTKSTNSKAPQPSRRVQDKVEPPEPFAQPSLTRDFTNKWITCKGREFHDRHKKSKEFTKLELQPTEICYNGPCVMRNVQRKLKEHQILSFDT